MPFDRAAAALTDILTNIGYVEEFIREVTAEQFFVDQLRLYATVRALEIISEASRRLPEDLKQRHPDVAWRDIAAAGNIYRHGYDSVIPERVWTTANNDLTTLRKAIEIELGQ